MLGRVLLPGEGEEKGIPEFLEDVNHSLKGVYIDMRQKLNEVPKRTNQNMIRKSLAATSL